MQKGKNSKLTKIFQNNYFSRRFTSPTGLMVLKNFFKEFRAPSLLKFSYFSNNYIMNLINRNWLDIEFHENVKYNYNYKI